jgi:hypothetical protein
MDYFHDNTQEGLNKPCKVEYNYDFDIGKQEESFYDVTLLHFDAAIHCGMQTKVPVLRSSLPPSTQFFSAHEIVTRELESGIRCRYP